MRDLGMEQTASLVVPGGHNMEGKSKYIMSFQEALSMPTNIRPPLAQITPPSVSSQDELIMEHSI